ncbi:MAG TPA: MFS transporter, partial [Anaerolineales bacterium]|nr:MFS transporter [Anaerolineales bacterium]
HIRAFKPNARFYLLNVIATGAAMGVFRLIFNFYALSLGFDEALLGNLITIGSFVALLVALPMGYLADLIGRKTSLIVSGVLLSVSIIAMAIWATETSFYWMSALSGLAQSLAGVTMS